MVMGWHHSIGTDGVRGNTGVNAKFISADGLSLETTIQYPPLLRIRRPLMNKRLSVTPIDLSETSLEGVIQTRDYDFTGMKNGVAIYEEII